MQATILNILQENNGVRVMVDFEGFGQKGFIFPIETSSDTVRAAIEEQKLEYQKAIDTKQSLETLIGEVI